MATHYKYPRTFHLPFSEGATSDDKTLTYQRLYSSSSLTEGSEIVVTEKMDGESFSGYRDYCHARSLDSRHHPSRDWVKSRWNGICHELPEGFRVCGESLFARHSIEYTELPSYLMVFSIWNDKNEALSWDETLEYCELLGLTPVPTLYRGPFDESVLKDLAASLDPETQEGYVVRVARSFHYDDFSNCVAKYVRKGHVQTDTHWMHSEIVPNQLKGG